MDIERILKEMTLEDKIALCSGASFWETKRFERYGIPALFMCDGPHGLRKQEDAADMLGVNNSRPATCFPAEVTTAGSWDPALLEQIGAAIGEWLGAQSGLGYFSRRMMTQLDGAGVFAPIVLLSAVAMLLVAVVALAERAVIRWRGEL